MKVYPIRCSMYRRCFVGIVRFKSSVEGFRSYDAYWPRAFINRMLNADLLVEGRLCYTSPTSAYVVNPSDGNRILLSSKALNRALPNDIVAVKLNAPELWRVRAFLEEPKDRPNHAISLIIPAEAEEEFLDESSDDRDPPSAVSNDFATSKPRFQLTTNDSLRKGQSTNVTKNNLRDPYPTVRQVLETSPSLLSDLFPGASSLKTLVLQEQQPLMPLPSRHLLRTGRVVDVLCEDLASRRLAGHLVFEPALLLPSAFVEAEGVDEFSRPQQGVIEGRDGLPLTVPNVNCFFVPERPHFPRIKLAPSSVPEDLWVNPHKADGVKYLCKIQDWPPGSLYPKAVLCGQVGDLLDIEPATQDILLSHGIHEDEFTQEMLKDLPASEADFLIPDYEYLRRRDYRSHCVVSIDPSTAKDMDDALHIKKCPNDTYEVGVHIADVSFFVRPMTPLDREAANRTTSTYLVQRVIPMLPPILSEHLCSLKPGVDRLAFSVIFKVDKEGNVIDSWFGRTVIRSCARLSYEDAKALLETPRQQLNSLASRIPVHGPFSLANIKCSVVYLDMLAQKMRTRRIDNGALLLDKIELQFDLTPSVAENTQSTAASVEEAEAQIRMQQGEKTVVQSETQSVGWPRGYMVKQRGSAHYLIEEWMLAANQAVARRLFYHAVQQKHREIILHADTKSITSTTITAAIGSIVPHPIKERRPKGSRSSFTGTILRRHPPPQLAKMENLIKIVSSAGISLDTSSAGAIRASLDTCIAELREKVTPEVEVQNLSAALSYLTYMRMQMALYFNVEDVVDRAIRRVRGSSDCAERLASASDTVDESWESSLLKFAHHFGLNVPLYTHFTSPIRRYADLLVHRQLADLLGCGHWSCRRPSTSSVPSSDTSSPVTFAPRRLTVQAAWCNRMRRETRRAQEESQQLFIAAWIKSSGSVQESAVVLGLENGKIQLLIPSYGLLLNHHLQKFFREAFSWQTEGNKAARDDKTRCPCITVRWEGATQEVKAEVRSEKVDATITKLSVFSVCPVRLTCSSRGLFVRAELLPPSNSGL